LYNTKKDLGIVIKNLVSKELCSFVSSEIRLIDKHINLNGNSITDERHPESLSLYSPFCTEILSTHIQSTIEEKLERKLIPTYSYCRIYRTGASLTEHLDRRSSEYTLSITLEDNDNDKWPLSVEMYDHTVLETTLDVGDALLYSGRDQMHWRPGKYKGKEIVQAFIQYVDAEGDSTNFGWDGRPLLGMPFESTDPSLDHNMDRTLDEQSIINRRLDK
jgi:hypothetical protein